MASATCSGVSQSIQTSSAGRRVCSRSCRPGPSQRIGEKASEDWGSLMGRYLIPRARFPQPCSRLIECRPSRAALFSAGMSLPCNISRIGGFRLKGDPKNLGFSTRAVHAGQHPDPRTGSVAVPIYQTSTYVQEHLGEAVHYEYARVQNPTREALEEQVAVLEGGVKAHAFASGMAAIACLMTVVQAGDH